MNQQQRKEFYPDCSFNSKDKCEKRWMDDANIYGDIDPKWNIALGNGKRLTKKWAQCGGLAFVPNQYGETTAIYNEKYDKALQNARHTYDPSFQPDVECGVGEYFGD